MLDNFKIQIFNNTHLQDNMYYIHTFTEEIDPKTIQNSFETSKYIQDNPIVNEAANVNSF